MHMYYNCIIIMYSLLCNQSILFMLAMLLAGGMHMVSNIASADRIRIGYSPIAKVLLCIIRNRKLLHTEHLSFLTTFVPPSTALSHSSHETVSNSRSKSRLHFSNVVYATFLFFSWEVPLVLQLSARFIIK